MMDDMSISHSELDLVKHCNDLLAHVGLDVKQIGSFKELTRAAPSLLVAVYESLFQERLSGVIRSPMVPSDYMNNAQCVIDGLSNQIQMGLQHISGESVAKGELRSLTNVIDIMRRIVSITGGSRLGGHGGIALSDEDRLASGSISTRDSFFDDQLEMNDTDGPLLRHSYKNGAVAPMELIGERGATESESNRDFKATPARESNIDSRGYSGTERAKTSQRTRRCHVRPQSIRKSVPRTAALQLDLDLLTSVPSFGAAEVKLKSTSALFAQEKKLSLAKQRREHLKMCRSNKAEMANRRRHVITQKTFQQRWKDDRQRETAAHVMRCNNESIVLQRKIYKSIVNQMGKIRLNEYEETKELLQKAKSDANCHIESLQRLFEDKLQLLREQEEKLQSQQKEQLKSEKCTSYEYLHGAQNEKLNNLILFRQRRLAQRREKQFNKAREENIRVLNSIEKKEILKRNNSGVDARQTPEPLGENIHVMHRGIERKSNGEGIGSSRPEILMELDKQVCDLVRQQQHASMSYVLNKDLDAVLLDNGENVPLENSSDRGPNQNRPDIVMQSKGNMRPQSAPITITRKPSAGATRLVKSNPKRVREPIKLASWK